jgi:3-methylcrotonyl-CoA carboxylase alpha subunit
MERLGVPVVPGYDGDDQALERLEAEGQRVGFPLLVKASAGGGGKGMRVVRQAAQLRDAIEGAQREAQKSFGNPQLLLERYIEQPRHVEFQIFGDSHGTIVHMFERDCSVQRRHQKVVEESPAPEYSEELRQRMAKAAIAAAAGVKYENAGTVEFIVTPQNEFYFLEMNTRLQVEHPVTEQVLGLDLVRLQLHVASGQPLPLSQDDLRQRGHAIECRIYAEDPDQNFLPQIGKVALYREPSGPGVRVDSGIEAGSEISVRYDPMLAKLIVTAENRAACIDRLLRALDEYVILGTTTNLPFLRRVVAHPTFREGRATTAFLGEEAASLQKKVSPIAAPIAALLSQRSKPARARASEEATISSPWEQVGSWGR